VALAQGGGTALAEQLISAVQDGGVEIRTKARVKSLVLADNVAAGVELDSGEKIFARAIVSGLSRRRTLLGLAPTASAGIAETLRLERAAPRRRETVFVFTLNAAPEFPQHGARLIATEGAPALEAVVTTSALPGQHLLAVRAKAETSADDVVAQLERFTPHLKGRIVSCETSVRDVLAPHLFDPAAARIATPIKGLFLCGADAEPMAAVSGRAGRLAADTIARKKRA
jgi:phytoene dehydrogenase-like protein